MRKLSLDTDGKSEGFSSGAARFHIAQGSPSLIEAVECFQRRILSGVNMASHTSRRGALNERVRTMVVSVGVPICRPWGDVVFMAAE